MPSWSVNASVSVSDENDGRGYRHDSGRGGDLQIKFLSTPDIHTVQSMENRQLVRGRASW